jgi:hypothetical protein
LEIFYLPFQALILAPPLALAPALLLGVCLRRNRPRLSRAGTGWVVAGIVLWCAYTLWECAVWVWSQDVTAPIRVDLLLIAPLLYAVSFVGFRACWKARRHH